MRILKNDLRRAVAHRGFLWAALALAALMYFGGYEEVHSERTIDLVDHLEMMLGMGPMSWAFPAFGALCYADAYVKDAQTGSLSYQMYRMGPSAYVLSKTAACFLSACLATMVGITLYTLGISPRFSALFYQGNLPAYESVINSFDALVVEGRYVLYMFMHILCESLAAGMWAVVGLALSCIWPNVYMAFIAPGVILYAKDYICAWLHVPFLQILRDYQLGYVTRVPGILLPAAMVFGLFAGISLALAAGMTVVIRGKERGFFRRSSG